MQIAMAEHGGNDEPYVLAAVYKVLMIHKLSYGVDHISLSNAKIRDSGS